MTEKCLFGAEVDRIQETLFRASRQRQVVGGSRLLDEFCRQIGELAKEHGAAPDDILINAGGNFRILFPAKEETNGRIEEFTGKLTNAYRLLLDASITVAPVTKTNGDFQDANEMIGEHIQRLKRSRRGQMDTPHAPSTAFCASSGVGLAADFDKPAGRENREYLSAFAQKMGDAGRKDGDAANAFLSEVSQYLPMPYKNWQWGDVDQFAALDGERANVAYLVADGNNMGQLFGECNARQLKDLSRHLDRAIRQALTVAQPTENIIVESPVMALARQLTEAGKYKDEKFLPLLPLILAGDDIFILLPAIYALDFARRFCLAFEYFIMQSEVIQALCQADPPVPPPTISAAVVFCKGSYPYHLAHRRGEELLKEAKKLVKSVGLKYGEWHSAISFDFIVGSELVNNEQESKRPYRGRMSPYWVVEGELGEDAEKASVSLDSWLIHRWLLHILPHKRLVQIREMFSPENLPQTKASTTQVDTWQHMWNDHLNRLRRQIEAGDPKNPQLLAVDQALFDLGNQSELEADRNPGHWRQISRPGQKLYQAHGLPELITAWPYAQSLGYALSDYEEAEK